MPRETDDEFAPATPSELSRFMAENAKHARRPVFPMGGRTALNYGYAATLDGINVSTGKLVDLIDYPTRDMTVTVEAGIRLDKLSSTLLANDHQLPIDVPQPYRATLGGALATNTSGPRRFGYGTLRDYVIGISAVDAQGRLFSAGGRVVKNVAGYDLCKLLIGSMGTLAIITQVTLKLRPLPKTTALLWLTLKSFADIESALQALQTSAARPVAIEVLDREAAALIASDSRTEVPLGYPVLCLGIEGIDQEVDWQLKQLQDECSPFQPVECVVVKDKHAAPLMHALTEFQTYADDPLTFQANMRPSKTIEFLEAATTRGVAVQSHAGNGLVVGRLPDEASDIQKAQQILTPLREAVRADRGNLVIFHGDPDWKRELAVFGDPEPSWPLMRKLKAELDPHCLMNPGRFIDGPAYC